MDPRDCTAVLLPDQAWHEVRPGSMSSDGERLTFVADGERYSLPSSTVLAARGRERELPVLQRL